ncbi:MAG: ATP-dependent RNA helicase HrpA [Verrucomicrobiota bacterium]
MQPPPTITYPPDLPICARREEIVAALRAHQVLIVAGETGSGKTTQLPKMCLEAGLDQRGRIGCTQPRRVAAMSISRRVAEELGVTWGREVGCKMRFNDDTGRDTRIKFMTDGILLAEIQSDPLLRAYSTLILDEAHERSLNIDFLLGYLQGLLKKRADLKLIITSATIDTEAFSQAFGGAPIMEVSGRLFPVEVRYQPIGETDEEGELVGDVSFVEAAARATEDALIETDSGDVLVFLPTERDIREARELLEETLGKNFEVLPLFGRLAGADQQRIFAPGGKRRVVLATNIAETSLTIPRIGTVIDTGLARMSRYNPRTRTKRLPVEPVSQSSANQRAGRAGRVRDGLCIRLYSQEDYEKRPRFTQPEIQRANLAEVILRMKAFRLGDVENFPFLNPPLPQAIRGGYQLLQELGAMLEAEGNTWVLTALGHELARLPLDPTLGRMLLEAREEGALEEMLVIAAGLSVPDPRERPEEAKETAAAAHKVFAHPESDFLTLLNLWNAAPPPEGKSVHTSRNALRRFCKANYLSLSRMREWRDIYRQLAETMRDNAGRGGHPRAAKLEFRGQVRAQSGDWEREDDRYAVIHRSILAGLLGQVAQREERNLYKASGNRAVTLFPGSGLYERNAKKPKPAASQKSATPKTRQPEWIVAGEIVQTSQLFARTVARVDPQWIVALGSHLCKFSYVHPQWSAKEGRVLVWERVLLHGLELCKRQVDYGRIDPAAATELFIRGALVAGEGRVQQRFFTANQSLRERIENALTKVRSHRVHDLDEALYRFYAERITGVSSIHDLNRLVRARITAEPRFLCATEADLMEADHLAYDREAFPDKVALGNSVLPLTYAYNPGEDEDGVTVRVPLPLAERLTPAELQWMVPGLREEQIGELLRSLPKSLRKQLMPLEPKVREIVAEFQPRGENMSAELGKWVAQKYRVPIQPEDWKALPDYLRPRVEVVDRHNKPVAAGRDLHAVRTAMDAQRVQSDAWETTARRWEKPAITAWSFGDLPESLVVEHVGGAPLLAWPGLAFHEGEVSVKLFRKRADAEAATPAGICRLAELALARDLAWLQKELRSLARPRGAQSTTKQPVAFGDALAQLSVQLHAPKPKGAAADSGDMLQQSAYRHIVTHAFRLEPLHPLTQARFNAMVEAARRELPLLARRVGELTTQILALRQALLASPKRYPGLEADLERLVPADFLAHTPHAQLPHLPRYLGAMKLRAERASISPLYLTKDAEKAKPLAPFLSGCAFEKTVPQQNREVFRWLLEEFRVSLFAQELGTAQPVSAQRLRALGE